MPWPMATAVVELVCPSTFPKRMWRASGAMPAYRASTAPLPTMVPVTWVPWPTTSTHRSRSSSRAALMPPGTKLAPQMLARPLAMSAW